MDEEPAEAGDDPSDAVVDETRDWETVDKAKPASPPWSESTKLAVAVGMVVFVALVVWLSRSVIST